MRSIAASLPFAGLTVLCWGAYGPVLHHSKAGMGNSSLAQLLCVGIAYFIIAVIIPIVVLYSRGETGNWTTGGFVWGLAAGTCGALGALGIITALNNGGNPIYVMPIFFGGAPVINTLVSMYMGKLFGKAGSGFFLGIILVAVGAAGVFIFKPAVEKAPTKAPSAVETQVEDDEDNEKAMDKVVSIGMVILGIGLTVLCWGAYGSVLHRSQAKMSGSRLRPFFCVGLAYFLIAVIVPIVLLGSRTESLDWRAAGAFGSMMAGACGAVGALGIILSFTYGGKPVFIMPLVFGGAPIVNTMIGIVEEGLGDGVGTMFIVSLTIVILGAITTLVCAPKPSPKGPPEDKPDYDDSDKPLRVADDESLAVTDDEPQAATEEEPPEATDDEL